MTANIILNIQLSFEIAKKEKWYVASCQALDVFSQGETEKQSEKNLKEALCLFLTSCIERGTLNAVLKECGFKPVPVIDIEKKSQERYISIPLHLLSDKVIPEQCPE
jgi:predicted RNase H-like HicB family nuclease